VTLALAAPLAHAEQVESLRNASQATGDSLDASARLVASGGQVVLGAVAVPLAAAGGLLEGTGAAADSIATDLWDAANTPLKVDDAVVMASPPPRLPALPVLARAGTVEE
jgi:hypothetical protein